MSWCFFIVCVLAMAISIIQFDQVPEEKCLGWKLYRIVLGSYSIVTAMITFAIGLKLLNQVNP